MVMAFPAEETLPEELRRAVGIEAVHTPCRGCLQMRQTMDVEEWVLKA